MRVYIVIINCIFASVLGRGGGGSFDRVSHIKCTCVCVCVCYITCSLNIIILRGREGFCMGLIIVIAESVRNNNN